MNGTGLLPGYYSTAPLWNKYMDDFLSIRQTPGACRHWEQSRAAGTALAAAIYSLLDSLKRIRQELSLEYDLPLVEASRADGN